MKTIINAKIILDSDKFDGFHMDTPREPSKPEVSVLGVVESINSGELVIKEAIDNMLMNDPEITLVIKDRS